MFTIRNFVKAISLSLGLAMLEPTTAFAQAAPNAVILVVDFQRLVDESLAGKDAKAQVEDYVARVQARRQQLNDKLVADRQNLEKQRAILKEEDFQKRAIAFQQDLQRADQELKDKQVSAQRAVRQAEGEIVRLARPIVRGLMQKRRANMVMPKNVAFDFLESLDITSKVLEQINKEVPKLKVALPES